MFLKVHRSTLKHKNTIQEVVFTDFGQKKQVCQKYKELQKCNKLRKGLTRYLETDSLCSDKFCCTLFLRFPGSDLNLKKLIQTKVFSDFCRKNEICRKYRKLQKCKKLSESLIRYLETNLFCSGKYCCELLQEVPGSNMKN